MKWLVLVALATAASAQECQREPPAAELLATADEPVAAWLASHQARRGQSVCLVAQRCGTSVSAWVIWPRARRVVLWEPLVADAPLEDQRQVLIRSRRDLGPEDTVATDEAVGSSTYLVSRRWYDGLLADCQKVGRWWPAKRATRRSK